MLSPSPAPSRLPGYDLGEPTESDARAALQRVFGAEGGAERWTRACRDAGMAEGHVTGTAQLERAAAALAAQGGPCAALARSIEIRVRTYNRLAARTRTGGQG